ncbi:MAG: GAF domain-containing protein [Methylobacteriaceae bacterium]|nr:GAF domain-containing protein [Methylobacteriaceae bacterium]
MTEVLQFRKRAAGAVVEPRPIPAVPDELNRAAYEQRVRQQEILTELGVLALRGTPFPELLEHTARIAAEGLRAEFAKVLEYLPEQNRLLVRAGVGWGPGIVGKATVGADLESPGGYALRTGVPVISNHLENEERFRTPELLVEYGIHRAMNVILQGEGTPFGVLEVDSRSEGEFSEQDITFLQGAANLLGMAIERQRMERDLRGALDRQQMLMREVNHRVNNSLQIVGSMLHLQGRRADSTDVQLQLQQASNRVTAIARAHNRLYRTDEFTRLDLGAYLSDLCADFCEATPGCEIYVAAPEHVVLSTDRAITVALLINELITNVAKYAYPEGMCRAWVNVSRQGRTITLSVRDEGIGLPPGMDESMSRGLGMRLVNAFTRQLNGSVEAKRRKPGTEFVITFEVES